MREPREADPADYNEGDVTSYSETDNLDDQFIEEALFLSPEDRDARDVEVGTFEDWAEQEVEEEGEIVEVVYQIYFLENTRNCRAAASTFLSFIQL